MTVKQRQQPKLLLLFFILLVVGVCNCWFTPRIVLGQKDEQSSKTAEEALKIYADAANFQNEGVYQVAIEEWQKLLKQFPSDPIVTKARHYLGVCYLQLETPDYENAIAQFRLALKDKDLEVREESLINLGWTLHRTTREPDAKNRARRLKESLAAFRAYLRDYRDGSFTDKALYYAGDCEYLLGRNKNADKYYRDLIGNDDYEKSPIRPDALYAMGANYEEMNRTAQAEDCYDEFISKYPDHRFIPEVKIRQAEILLKTNKADQAVGLLSQVLDEGQTVMPDYVLYRYGFALAKVGDFEKSSQVYRKLVNDFPDSQYAANSMLSAGQALLREGKNDEAAGYFEQLLDQENESAAEAAHWLATIAQQKREFAKAAAIAEQAIRWADETPSAPLLRMDLADAIYEIPERRAESKEVYEKIAADFPKHPVAPRALYNAAFAAIQLGSPEQTRQLSALFVKQYNDHPLLGDAEYLQAESLLQLGKAKESADAFRSVIADYPDNPGLPLWEMRLATAEFLNGNFETVVEETNKRLSTIRDNNGRAEALLLIGASQIQLEKFDSAVEALKGSYSENPKWFKADEVLWLLSEAYTELEKSDESKSTLERLLKEFPNTRFKSEAELRLGQISSLLQDYSSAITMFDRVIDSSAEQSVKRVAISNKAMAQMRTEQYKAALKTLEPMLLDSSRSDELSRESSLIYAICTRNLGRYDAAEKTLVNLMKTMGNSPQLANTKYELALTFLAKQDYAAAAKSLEEIRSDFPSYENLDKVLYELGWAYKDLQQAEKSSEVFSKLARQYPGGELAAEANFHVGQNQYQSEQFDNAVAAYSIAFKNSSDSDLQEKALHKLAWSYFKKGEFAEASRYFEQHVSEFPDGTLVLDGEFMQAECLFEQEAYVDTFPLYQIIRKKVESAVGEAPLPDDAQSLVYLHGAQSARELERWEAVVEWVEVLLQKYPETPYRAQAIYELAFGLQNQNKPRLALERYEEVATKYRNDVAARARFMVGEIYFASRDYAKAIPEFQRVMFGFGGEQAVDEIKDWQARAAIEAGRCAEILIGDLRGQRRDKAISIASGFYQYIVDRHPENELVDQASKRLAELERM